MQILYIAIVGFMWLAPRVSPFETDHGGNGVTEEQLKEIQLLREELNPKVAPRVSAKAITEVDAIREEIMNAVNTKKYSHGSDPSHQLLNAAHLWGSLGNLFKRRRISTHQEDDSEKDDSDFHIQFPHFTEIYREVLHLDSVQEDMSFDLGQNVFFWKTLHQRKSGKHSLIGITNSSVVLLRENEGHYEFVSELELPSNPTNLEGFVQWDAEDEAAEGIALVSMANELLWIELGTNFENLTISWRWDTHKNLTEIDFFFLMKEPMLILISEASSSGGKTSADIYRFDYAKRDFWLVQTIPLSISSTSVAVLEDGSNLILAIPQKNTTKLYKYVKESSFNRHFDHFQDIESPEVAHVASFRIGGQSHLAIGGIHPQIWRLEDDTLKTVDIRHNHFGLVDFWLPIVATTYRDDLIILVQHRIKLKTHTMTKLEVLVWNGEFFSILLNVPCILSDIHSQFGISCMLDFDRDRGLDGSTVIRHGKNISVLVPRDDADSGLFKLNMKMSPAYHPEQEHLEEFKMMYDYFNTLKEHKDGVLEVAIDTIKNAININEFNSISGDWIVKSLTTPVFEDATGEVEFGEENKISVGDKIWTLADFELDIPTISDVLEEMENGLDSLIYETVKNAQNHVKTIRDSASIYLGNVLSNGHFSTEGLYVLNPDETDKGPVESDLREKRETNSTELVVQFLEVNNINGIPSSDLVFGGDKIAIESDLIIIGPLEVEDVFLRGKANGKFLHEAIIETESETYYRDILEFASLHIRDDISIQESVNGMNLEQFAKVFITPTFPGDVIADENITISGDLTFNTINGVSWKKFLQSIVLTNLPISLQKVKINGDVSFMENVEIDMLNKALFPSGFLWASNDTSDKPPSTVITGRKQFKTLVVSLVDAEKTINGMDVDKIITINSEQDIPGQTTFGNLEVIGGLEIDGNVHGKHLDEFLENPTLLETQHVRSACLFRDLRIEGNIIVNKTLNGVDLHEILRDVVYTTDHNINMTSFKSFDNVIFNSGVTLVSNLLNGVPLTEYVLKDTEQELQIREMNVDIYFHSLDLDGLFNLVNVTELDYNSIKLSGQQHTEAEIIFENDDLGEFVDIFAGNMDVTDSINGFRVHDLIDITSDIEVEANMEFQNLRVDHIELHGDLIGEFLVNNINLGDLDSRRLSISREQIIEAPFHIQHAQIDLVNVSRLNNLSTEHVESLLRNAENLQEVISLGQIPINSITVHGDVNIEMFNGQNFTQIAALAIWLDKTNIFQDEIIFLDKIRFLGNLFLEEKLNKKDIEFFIENLVQRSGNLITLDGQKTFRKGIHVTEGVEIDFVNHLNVSNILIEGKHNVINGDLIISGNLIVKNLTFSGKINEFPISYFMDLYSYNHLEKVHHIRRNVYFQDHPYIHELFVEEHLNNLENVSEYLEGILLKSQKTYNITGRKIFVNNVFFENSLIMNYVNGMDFKDFAENVVLIDTKNSAEIYGNVTFVSELLETPEVFIRNNLATDSIMYLNLNQLIKDAIWKNRNMYLPMNVTFHQGSHNGESIETDFLNGILMFEFITLDIEQEIEDVLVIPNVLANQPISIDGFVNGVKLPEEYENTLMVYGNQTIETSTSFHQARVLNSLTTSGLVNNQDIRSVALLNSDLMITTPVSFDHMSVQEMFTEHIISGINFTRWHESVMWKTNKTNQIVNGQWVFKKCHIEKFLEGDGSINKIDFVNMMTHFSDNRHQLAKKVEHSEKLIREFCQKINNLLHTSRHNICFFRYFERHDSILERVEEITSHKFYENNGQNYFIYSAGCHSKLYQWNSAKKRFNLSITINTGQIDEWILVEDAIGNAHLVANGPENPKCNERGSAVWKWNGSNLSRVTLIDQHFHSILSNTLSPGHFFAIDKNNAVTEFDLEGKAGEKWEEPTNTTLKFIPQESNLGLAFTDGKQIKMMQKHIRRNKRLFDDVKILEDSSDDFVDLLRNYSDIIRSNNSKTNTSDLFDENFTNSEIVGSKLFDKFQNLMKNGSKAFVDTTFMLVEILNQDEKRDGEIEDEHYVSKASSSNTTDTENIITKEEFLNTLKYVLAKKRYLIDIAFHALAKTDSSREITTFTLNKINSTALRSEDFVKLAEDSIDFWLMELLMIDKINEIGEDVRQPLEEVNLTKFDASYDPFPMRMTFPEDGNLAESLLTAGRDFSEPTVIYSDMDSPFEELTGEAVVLTVGHPHRRKLIAVASRRKSTVPGRHDVIYLYENIIGDKIFQTLPCQKPSGLTALHLRDETLLIFVEAGVDVKIYSYYGIMGFREISQFRLNSPALHLTTVSLPVEMDYHVNYLVVTMMKEILFLEAKLMGNCRMDVNVNCDD